MKSAAAKSCEIPQLEGGSQGDREACIYPTNNSQIAEVVQYGRNLTFLVKDQITVVAFLALFGLLTHC